MLYYMRSNKELIGFKYNEDVYYYIRNNQNDIIGILDSNYNIVSKYKYDSWGNIVSITDENDNDISNNNEHIANINPYRYRGYYYDKESKLYYLNSRYYNPKWGRFINVDGIISSGDTIEGNLYSYCSNDPVNKVDSSGQFSIKKLFKDIGKFISNAVKTIKNVVGKVISTKDVSRHDIPPKTGINLIIVDITNKNTVTKTNFKTGKDNSLFKVTSYNPDKIFDLKNLKINIPTTELSTNNGHLDIGLETGDGWAVNASWKQKEGYGNFSIGATAFGKLFIDFGTSSEEKLGVQNSNHTTISVNVLILALAYAYQAEASLSSLLKTIFSSPKKAYN